MASLNRVSLIGNLGDDPEARYLPDGTATAVIRMATTDVWKDRESGEKKEKTEWHRVILYRGLADIAKEYLKKGAQIYIEGKLRTRKWTDKENVERYTTEIVGEEMKMLGRRRDDSPATVTDEAPAGVGVAEPVGEPF